MCKVHCHPVKVSEYCGCFAYNGNEMVAKEKGIDVSNFLSERNGEKSSSNANNVTRKCRTPTVQPVKQAPGEKGPQPSNGCHVLPEKQDEMSLLQRLALSALDLTAPAASDLLVKNRKNSWIQLSGHEGAFALAGPGTIWKKHLVTDETEVRAYRGLMDDVTRDMIPKFYKAVEYKNNHYIEMKDLLFGFEEPSVMDIKIGTRTFTEAEVKNLVPRPDLYQKMVAIDPDAATLEEKSAGAVTKLRYMDFREKLSSSSTLGFRIEAVKYGKAAPVKDMKLVKSREQITNTLNKFFDKREYHREQILARLKSMRKCFKESSFFERHEVIGSSILIIHDASKVGAWMIDFAKTLPLPKGVHITHRKSWVYGNHEDGYLTGLDNLINVIEDWTTTSTSDSKLVPT